MRIRAVVCLVAGYLLGFAVVALAIAAAGVALLGVAGLVARERGGEGTFLAFGPARLLLLAPALAALALGLGLLGVRLYRRR